MKNQKDELYFRKQQTTEAPQNAGSECQPERDPVEEFDRWVRNEVLMGPAFDRDHDRIVVVPFHNETFETSGVGLESVRNLLSGIRSDLETAFPKEAAIVVIAGSGRESRAWREIESLATEVFDGPGAQIAFAGFEKLDGAHGKNYTHRFVALLSSRENAPAALIDADLRPDSGFISGLFNRLEPGRKQIAIPAYTRAYDSDDTALNDHVFGPVAGLLNGGYVQSVLAGEYAVSPESARDLTGEQQVWSLENDILTAVRRGGGAILQTEAGEKKHKPVPRRNIFARTVFYTESLLRAWDNSHQAYLETDIETVAETVAAGGNALADASAGSFTSIDREAWFEELLSSWRASRESLQYYLNDDDAAALRARLDELTASGSAGGFNLSAAEWARYLTAFYAAYHRRDERERIGIAELVKPVFLARVISFSRATEQDTVAEMRARLVEQSRAFLEERDRRFPYEREIAKLKGVIRARVRQKNENVFLPQTEAELTNLRKSQPRLG